MSEAHDIIRHHRIGTVVQAADPGTVLAYGRAAALGGFRILALPVGVPEVTEVVAELADELDSCIGIADVTSMDQVALAMAAGAEFVLSPICDPDMVRACKERGLVVIAGALTPSEIVRARACGPDLVALYPIAALGGPEYLKFIRRQTQGIPLVGFGGVDVDNGPSYLEAGAAAIFIDSGLFPAEGGPEAIEIISARSGAFLEVCSEVVGTPP